jgi:hypothetical protein
MLGSFTLVSSLQLHQVEVEVAVAVVAVHFSSVNLLQKIQRILLIQSY